MNRFHPVSRFTTAFDGLSLMDDAFRSFDRMLRSPGFARTPSAWAGLSDARIETTEDGWTITADLPGVESGDLEIEAYGDTLRIRAQREEKAPDGYQLRHRERSALSFERALQFGRGFDGDSVAAELKNGVLTVKVPKRAEEKPRAISVRTAS